MSKPIVAIIGRPNVGKSTFFNRLIGERYSIVEGQPGTTRDRLYGETEWNGRVFTVVDTAGLAGDDDDPNLPPGAIARLARMQAHIAIEEADVIVFLVDAKDGLTSTDADIAEMLRKTSKPVILAVNKADNQERALDAVEFYQLHLGTPFPMSGYHGIGTGDVLDAIVAALPPPVPPEEEAESIRVAIVGRPNVGKSTLLNTLLGQERSVVSPIPGTTRDSIDTLIVHQDIAFTLIDTAGIRRAGRIEQGVERYSVLRTLRAIERCDVALLLVDAQEGITAQDTHIAGMVIEEKKSIIIIVNKWDAIAKDPYTFDEYTRAIREQFRFLPYAPLLFISAATGQRVQKILPLVQEVYQWRNKRIPTSEMNEILRQALASHPPAATKKGAHLRIYYATQPQTNPPVFLFFANNSEIVHWSYVRYLENRIRERYPFVGTPITITFRSSHQRELQR